VKPPTLLRVFPTKRFTFDVVIAFIDRTGLCIIVEHILVGVKLLTLAFANKFIASAERAISSIVNFIREVRIYSHVSANKKLIVFVGFAK